MLDLNRCLPGIDSAKSSRKNGHCHTISVVYRWSEVHAKAKAVLVNLIKMKRNFSSAGDYWLMSPMKALQLCK